MERCSLPSPRGHEWRWTTAYWETSGSQTYVAPAGQSYFASDISPDGSVIAGKGRQRGVGGQQVFRLELPPPPSTVPALEGPFPLGVLAVLLLTAGHLALAHRARGRRRTPAGRQWKVSSQNA